MPHAYECVLLLLDGWLAVSKLQHALFCGSFRTSPPLPCLVSHLAGFAPLELILCDCTIGIYEDDKPQFVRCLRAVVHQDVSEAGQGRGALPSLGSSTGATPQSGATSA